MEGRALTAFAPRSEIKIPRWIMLISAIAAGSSLGQSLQLWQTKAEKIQTEFQQLGQDLQAGNLSQAQSDFSLLSQNVSRASPSNGNLAQAFSALGTALQSGNLQAAQQAYSAVQQDVLAAGGGHHHHHAGGSSPAASSSASSPWSQLLGSLGKALQSGNLSAAQTAYTTLSQDLPRLGWSAGTSSPAGTGMVSLLG
jgi:hypothetical protein